MIKNIIQTLFTKGFIASVNFLILIISARYLGVDTRGEIGLFILNIANIQIINEIYTGYSLVHFLPKFNLRKVVLNGFIWTIISTGISSFLFVMLNKNITGFEWDLFFLSVMIILNTFNLVVILAKENIRLYNFLSLFQPLLLLCGLAYYTLILNSYTLSSYIIPLYISFSVSFIVSSYAVIKYLINSKPLGEYSIKMILENGFFCQLAGLFHSLANRFSFYILGSSTLVGIYSTASSLIESVWIIANGITPVVLSKISNTGNTEFNKKIIFTLAKASLILSIVAVICLCLLPNSVFIFLLGNGFAEVKNIMMWIAPGVLFVSFSTLISHYFSGLGNLKFVALCNFFGFLVAIILAPFLIKHYGLTGAAITANFSYFISAVALLAGFLIKTKIKASSIINFKNDFNNIKQAFKP